MNFREKEKVMQYKRKQVSEDIDIPHYEENLTVITERDQMENQTWQIGNIRSAVARACLNARLCFQN